jgi:uncharacterized protein YkwD
VRAALVAMPTDRATLERLARDANDLLQSRRYDQVQTTIDDTRAALEQGLREQGSGALPPLSTIEQNSITTVREALARAKAAAATGDTATADAAVDQARRAAQAAEDDAIAVARGGGEQPAGAGDSLSYADAGGTLNPLAAAGVLLRGASLAIGLGMAPGDDFWNLLQQLLSSQITLPNTILQGGSGSLSGPPPALPPLPPPAASACGIDPAQVGLDSEELAMLAHMNTLRAANGLPALQISIALQRTAASKADDMATHHVYQHDADFTTGHQRFQDCGYPAQGGTYIAENLNGGHPDANTVFSDWQSDSGHRDNLVNPLYQYVGIKRVKLPDPGDPLGWVWVADFGSAPDGS